jgi:hypothetical protein
VVAAPVITEEVLGDMRRLMEAAEAAEAARSSVTAPPLSLRVAAVVLLIMLRVEMELGQVVVAAVVLMLISPPAIPPRTPPMDTG